MDRDVEQGDEKMAKKKPTPPPELGAVENVDNPGTAAATNTGTLPEVATTGTTETATMEPLKPVEETDTEKLKKSLDRLALIVEARETLRDRQLDVSEKEQLKKEADANLKAAVGSRDAAVIELERIIDDDRSGQMRLPFLAAVGNKQPVLVDSADTSPTSVLNTASILGLVGQDTWEAAKNREEPIGMTPSHMDKIEAADIRTVGALEKLMREDRYWIQTLKLGEKGGQRLVETLRVWRTKNPVPEVSEPERPKTIVESLAEKNDAATAADTSEVKPLPTLPGMEPESPVAPAGEQSAA